MFWSTKPSQTKSMIGEELIQTNVVQFPNDVQNILRFCTYSFEPVSILDRIKDRGPV